MAPSERPDSPAPDDHASGRDTGAPVRIRIRKDHPGRRLDKYLQTRFPRMSRTKLQRLIKQGAVLVNEKPSKPSAELRAGDVIELEDPTPPPIEIVPEPIPIKVLYEDDAIIAVNKRAGIVCHPGHPEQTGTLVNALAYYATTLSNCEDPFRPGIVHRLDKNTTGVMIVAKTDEAHWRLALQFEQRTTQKVYIAIVHGEVPLDGDIIDAPIGMHPVVREKFSVLYKQNKINIGKNAVTRYEVAERFRNYSLMKLFPKTGRTHQLRVHMSYIGHPIVGDTMYGGKPVSERSLSGQLEHSEEVFLRRQALHAWRLGFTHPITEQPMRIEAPFPKSMRFLMYLLRKWRAIAPTG